VTAIKMTMRTCATLALLLGLTMWIFGLAIPPLVLSHIALAVILLVLSVTWLIMSRQSNSTLRTLQAVIIALVLVTMVAGNYQGNIGYPTGNIIHLILALALIGTIETTIARQNRLARATMSQRA